jgi:hypothetical protein
MNIPPWFGIIVSGLSTALLGVGATTASDPTTQKIVLAAGAVGNLLSLFSHAFSSTQAGPLASPPAK